MMCVFLWLYHYIAHVQKCVIIRDALIFLIQFLSLSMNHLTSIHLDAFINATKLKAMGVILNLYSISCFKDTETRI